jgi:hypothetical protein
MHWGNTQEREDPTETATKRATDIAFERRKLAELDASDAEARQKHVYDPWQLNRHLTLSAHERSARKERLGRLLDEARVNGDTTATEWRPATAGFTGSQW